MRKERIKKGDMVSVVASGNTMTGQVINMQPKSYTLRLSDCSIDNFFEYEIAKVDEKHKKISGFGK